MDFDLDVIHRFNWRNLVVLLLKTHSNCHTGQWFIIVSLTFTFLSSWPKGHTTDWFQTFNSISTRSAASSTRMIGALLPVGHFVLGVPCAHILYFFYNDPQTFLSRNEKINTTRCSTSVTFLSHTVSVLRSQHWSWPAPQVNSIFSAEMFVLICLTSPWIKWTISTAETLPVSTTEAADQWHRYDIHSGPGLQSQAAVITVFFSQHFTDSSQL